MKVTNSSPNFTSRNAYIRRADDIVRHVRNEFPMFSPTNAWDNWRVLKPKNPICAKARKIIRRQNDLVEGYRKNTHLSKDNPCFIDIFENVQRTKVGNCRESSTLTLGTLFANGYRAVKVVPTIDMHVIDKNEQDVFTCLKPCDHAVVMAKMNKQTKEFNNDSAILDTWLGKAMSYNEALKEYQSYIPEEYLFALLKTHKELIKEKGLIKGLKIILDSKTTYKPKILFVGSKELDFSFQEGQKHGKAIAEKFPQVVMRDK